MQPIPSLGKIQALPAAQLGWTSSWTAPMRRLFTLAGVLALSGALLGVVMVSAPSFPWGRAVPGFLAVAGESFIPVLPLGPLVALNVLLLGAWDGFLVSWLGALVGSSGGYWLARVLGRAWVMRKLPPAYRSRVDTLAAKASFTGLLLAWLIPGVNCVVSCAAGIGGVSFGVFLTTCALGLLPWVGLYAVLAHDLATAGTYGIGLAAAALLLAALYLARRWLVPSYGAKADAVPELP